MADRTSIEVTEATWNPVTGCDPVSPGCQRCYARRFALRLAGRYGYPRHKPFAVTVHEARFHLLRQWQRPRHVFVCSMGDLLHPDVPLAVAQRVLHCMAAEPRHTYMLLTKRPEGLAALLGGLEAGARAVLEQRLWLGVSVENQDCATRRLPRLFETWNGPALACAEPLLGPLDLGPWLQGPRALGWVICGGETGPGGRPAQESQVRGLRDQCLAHGVPFFFKNWGGPSKQRAGRVLDGRTWDGLPNVPPPSGPTSGGEPCA